jgi:hypothetical protein
MYPCKDRRKILTEGHPKGSPAILVAAASEGISFSEWLDGMSGWA